MRAVVDLRGAEPAHERRVLLVRAPGARGGDRAGGVAVVAALHLGALAALVRGPTAGLVALAVASYGVRLFAVTCAYHRYFAHRSYRAGRLVQLALAALGTTAAVGGPLSFAARDRARHRGAGRPVTHARALVEATSPARLERVRDFAGYPELRWLDRHHLVGPAVLAGALALVGGVDALLWGFALPSCAIAHVVAWLRACPSDARRGGPAAGLLTLGEGCRARDTRHRGRARLASSRWAIDLGWLGLRALARLGLIGRLRAEAPRAAQPGE